MKNIFILVFLFLHLAISGQEQLKINDNVNDYIKSVELKYMVYKEKLSSWNESEVFAYSDTADAQNLKTIILTAKNKYPFGALQNTENGAYVLIDSDGDGILDLKSENDILIPFWIVSKETKNKSNENNIEKYLDEVYEIFVSDAGPYFQRRILTFYEKIDNDFADENRMNRDLIYALKLYYKISMISPEHAFTLFRDFVLQYTERFGKDHKLFFLHMAETLLNLGDKTKAGAMIQKLLELDEDCVPALVYQYQLEENGKKKEMLFQRLKQHHPNHWIVKHI